jgi:hypothetical protein
MIRLIKKQAGRVVANRARAVAQEFLAQTSRADQVQRDLLLNNIRRNATSAFGRDHDFANIRDAADFRRRVPVRGYEGHEPYIERVRNGELEALFGGPTRVLMFAKTSGTTARPKTIPVTEEALTAYRDGWRIWGITAFDDHPEIIQEGLKPILQLASDWQESKTPSGIPCGAITGLTAQMQNRLVRTTYCMPAQGSKVKDVEAKYYLALRMSAHRDLGAAIAANPSTMLGIARLGDREKETLIRDIRDGTIDPKWEIAPEIRQSLRLRPRWKRRAAAARLDEIAARTGRLLPKDYWPNLQFVATWTGGTMGCYLSEFPEFFGATPVRDPGLIASEGRMTIPVADGTPAGILDIRHHYFEFIPEDQEDKEHPETVEAADLVEGRRYFLLLTTAGGLYRYHIRDLVRCVGFHGKAPLVEFLNKGAHFSSLTGEKLSEFHVVAAAQGAKAELGIKLKSYLLIPSWGQPPFYNLLVEEGDLPDASTGERLAAAMDAHLCRSNEEYENRRETRRLGPVRLRRLPAGSWAEFQRSRLRASGGTVEQYKQPCLLADMNQLGAFGLEESGPAAAGQEIGELA